MGQLASADVPKPNPPDAPAIGGDSIAEQLQARLSHLPAVPGDALDWTALAALYEREAAALGADPKAAHLLHEAGRIHEERLADLAGALACYRRAAEIDRYFVPNLQAARRIANTVGDVALECELLEAEARAARSPRDEAALDLVRARLLEERLGRVSEGREALASAARADPESVAVAEQLATHAAAEGRSEDLARALEKCAEHAGDAGFAAAWLVAASAVEEHRLERPDRAADLAFRAFELAPTDANVRAAARRHAERQRRFDLLARICAAEAAAEVGHPREAALALCALARLEHEHLARPEQARSALEEARRVGGSDPVVLDALAAIHESSGDWEAAADVLRARGQSHEEGRPETPDEVISHNLRLAELYEERLGRSEDAAACHRAVLSVDPRHRGALAALGRFHARAGDWERVLETFLAERDAASDDRERAQRCFKAGEVLEERLGRVEEAVRAYSEALELEPSLLAAHQALERLYERSGRFAELAALLEADLATTLQPEERIALLFRLARLHEDRLTDLDAAARDCERILELAPEHVVALRTLAAVHERAKRFPELVALLERLGRQTTDPRKSIALLQRTGEVQEEHLADEAAASGTYERLLRLDPTHLPALRALGRLHARAGRWTELVAMCRAEAEASTSPESAAALLFRVGELLERHLGQGREAVVAYREALALAPAHLGALRALARLHRAHGDWQELVEVLRAEAAVRAAPERRAALLLEAAEIQETRLADLDGAVEVHREILRLAPGFKPSVCALDRMLADRGHWAELVQLRREEARSERGAARAESLVRVAELLAERLGDGAAAEQACREALAEVPDHPGALLLLARSPAGRSDAREHLAAKLPEAHAAAQLLVGAALDRVAAGGDGAADLARAVELAPAHPVAAPLVEGALRTAGSARALASHLAAWRDAEPEHLPRTLCGLRAGEAWEEAGDLERALAACREALALSPDMLAALHAARRLHARAGDWGEVRATLQHEGCVLREPGMAALAFSEAGEIALSRLGDQAGAASDWRRALELDPLDEAVAGRLAVLLQASGRPAELCELREMRARAEQEPARAAEAWISAAQLAFETNDSVRALEDLEKALAARPASAQALLLRGKILSRVGRHAEATRDLSACLAVGGDAAAAAPVHLELAALYQGPLSDPPRAMSHLNAILAAAPENMEALSRLALAHRQAQNWPAAADALRRLIALPSLPEERHDHLVELADVRADGFGDVAGAIELCELALELTPGDGAVLGRLARLKERAGDPPGLASALEAAAAAAPDGPERARVHLRAARVLSGVLGDDQRAVRELRRAVEADPGHPAARSALAALYASFEPALAIEEHRRFLAEDPTRQESWRALYDIFRAAQLHDRAFVAAAALRFLQASDPAADGAFYAENVLQAPNSTSQVLTPSDWLAVRHPADRGPLSDILAIVGDALAEVAGIAPATREKLKGAQPLWRLVEELCTNLGVEPFALRQGGAGAELWIEPGDPPAVRAGAELARRHSVPEQRFLLARAVARVRARSGLATRLDARALGELIAAAVRQVTPNYEGTGRPSEGLVKAVARALPRRLRKSLDEPVRALVPQGPQDVASWQAALAATADRVGLLLATDLPSALALVLSQDGAPARNAAEIAAAVRARTDVQRLLVFTASEEHLRLRQRLKLAIA
jgi:tetratricopeptide (TPR) repeat protein